MSKNTVTFAQLLAQLLRPKVQEYDRKLPTIVKRILGHAIIALFVALIIALLFIKPLPVLTCRYVESTQVDCHLEKRIAWVIPVQEIPITHLEKAYVYEKRITSRDEDGTAYTHYAYEVVLVSSSGETSLTAADTTSFESASTVHQINAYLDTPTDEPLTIQGHGLWDHTLLTLSLGVFLILPSSFLFVTTLVNSILLFGAWIIEFVLFVAEWAMDRAGLWPKVRGQIARLRRAMRGIAIQPDDNDSA